MHARRHSDLPPAARSSANHIDDSQNLPSNLVGGENQDGIFGAAPAALAVSATPAVASAVTTNPARSPFGFTSLPPLRIRTGGDGPGINKLPISASHSTPVLATQYNSFGARNTQMPEQAHAHSRLISGFDAKNTSGNYAEEYTPVGTINHAEYSRGYPHNQAFSELTYNRDLVSSQTPKPMSKAFAITTTTTVDNDNHFTFTASSEEHYTLDYDNTLKQNRATGSFRRYFTKDFYKRNKHILTAFLFYVVCTLICLTVFWIFHAKIFFALSFLALYGQFNKPVGCLILILLLWIVSFPPLFGYSIFLCMCGYMYGLPLGLVPAYTGALLGGLSCYALGRSPFSRRYTSKIMTTNSTFAALSTTLKSHGLRLLIPLRLAPYPYNYTNLVLGAVGAKLKDFLVATVLSVGIKGAFEVYVGSCLHSLADLLPSIIKAKDKAAASGEDSESQRTVNYVSVGVSVTVIVIGIGTSFWLYFRVKRVLDKARKPDHLEEQRSKLLDATTSPTFQNPEIVATVDTDKEQCGVD